MENHFLTFSESTLQSWLRVKVRRKWEVPKIEHFWAKDLKRDIILKKKGHKVDYGRLKQALAQYYVNVIVSNKDLFDQSQVLLAVVWSLEERLKEQFPRKSN